jgi:chromosome segregation ATPase
MDTQAQLSDSQRKVREVSADLKLAESLKKKSDDALEESLRACEAEEHSRRALEEQLEEARNVAAENAARADEEQLGRTDEKRRVAELLRDLGSKDREAASVREQLAVLQKQASALTAEVSSLTSALELSKVEAAAERESRKRTDRKSCAFSL